MGRAVSVVSVVVEGQLDWGTAFARDIALAVANATNITYLFGDTIGPFNPDGTVVSISGARATFAAPLVVTDFATATVGQVVPYTSAEATWNLEGAGAHPYRWGLPPLGAVLEGQSVRFFYVLDQPDYTTAPGDFYAAFPMVKLWTALLGPTAETVTRVPGDEIAIAANEWVTGFHRAPDGSVRFFRQFANDGEGYSTFKRGCWTAAGGFTFSTKTAFRLDAGMGISVRYSTPRGQWLVTYIDKAGRICLAVLNGKVTGSRVLYQIPSWAGPWDGYGAAFIDDGTDTDVFLILYSAAVPGFLTGDIPVIRVTVTGG